MMISDILNHFKVFMNPLAIVLPTNFDTVKAQTLDLHET